MTSGSTDTVPQSAKQLYALGQNTERAVREMFRSTQTPLFPEDPAAAALTKDEYDYLADALLHPKWSDDEAATLIKGLASRRQEKGSLDLALIERWVRAHFNQSQLVLLCLNVDPPPEIEIRRVLSQAGSQKVVYLALWRLRQHDVVVKQLLNPSDTAIRELEAFPLNLSHPNIIETHRLTNKTSELFLVEELLPEVLSDQWRAPGVQEAANLLYDIGAALKYLHDQKRVHGDVKPDNIGKRQGDYILLDFGICRTIDKFSLESSATGSVRTRAPELLGLEKYADPPKVDVWALGATVFASLCGRFPLLKEGEPVPRIWEETRRKDFVDELGRRATEEWERWVDLEGVPTELREILGAMLERDPKKRIRSVDVLERIERGLPALLRRAAEKIERDGRFSPLDELRQIEQFVAVLLSDTPLPEHKRTALRERLRELEATEGFSKDDRALTARLAERLGR